ncbi:MAG: hypothetical protein A2571_01770 [Candidatus Vogelbacteria bacterium RIFOXYD1_FULL_44_32]|uniref:Uncharacterized protein n=1 Tax=Candidatus Vogelbacteria bacterium RIFOXYD1_FULL_44_32 TaxID=1802438 RepID=A0A1G2QD46_9BACT|nr:MAG: hypothetical protein A2571_01770 [Candidatus Vogelbacteria bacterium RIFOXYD1_FULL_44_32]
MSSEKVKVDSNADEHEPTKEGELFLETENQDRDKIVFNQKKDREQEEQEERLQYLADQAEEDFHQLKLQDIKDKLLKKEEPLPDIVKVPNLQSVRQEQKTAKKSFQQKIKDKMVDTVLGKDYRKESAWIYYLEKNIPVKKYIRESIAVSDGGAEAVIAKHQAEEYEVTDDYVIHMGEEPTREISFAKEMPYVMAKPQNEFDRGDQDKLRSYLHLRHDPVEVTELLKLAGREVFANNFVEHNYYFGKTMRELIDTPHIVEVLQWLIQVGVTFDYIYDSYLEKLCSSPYVEKLTPQLASAVRATVGGETKHLMYMLPDCLDRNIFEGEHAGEDFQIIRKFGFELFDKLDEVGLLGEARKLVGQGIFKIEKLFDEFKSKNFSGNNDSQARLETFANIINSSALQSLEKDEGAMAIAKKLHRLVGIQIEPTDPDLEKLKILETDPTAMAVAGVLNRLSGADHFFGDLDDFVKIMGDKRAVESLCDEKAIDFVSRFIKQYHYRLGLSDFTPPYSIFDIPNQLDQEKLLAADTVALYEKLHTLGYNLNLCKLDVFMGMVENKDQWQEILADDIYTELLRSILKKSSLEDIKDVLLIEQVEAKLLNQLSTAFDYSINEDYAKSDRSYVTALLSHPEQIEALFEPQRIALIKHLNRRTRGFGYYVGGFHLRELNSYMKIPLETLRIFELFDKTDGNTVGSSEIDLIKQLVGYKNEEILKAVSILENLLLVEKSNGPSSGSEKFKFRLESDSLRTVLEVLQNGFTVTDLQKLQDFWLKKYGDSYGRHYTLEDKQVKASRDILQYLPQLVAFEKDEANLEAIYQEISEYLGSFRGDLDLFTVDKIVKIRDIGLLEVFRKIKDDQRVVQFVYANVDKYSEIPPEKIEDYISVIIKINQSPSQEIQRLKNSLMGEIMATSDPVAAYDKIEQVFVKNNLPLVGKVYKIFEIIHPAAVLAQQVKKCPSPELKKKRGRAVQATFLSDLLQVHIDSANRSLRDYLEVLALGEDVLNQAEDEGFDSLQTEDEQLLKAVFAKLRTLFEVSQLGSSAEVGPLADPDLQNQYEKLKQSLKVGPGQKITDRITDMFLRPIGARTMGEVLERMKSAKELAHQRNVEAVQQADHGYVEVAPGDLLKGVRAEFIEDILQNGSVAKEFLGGKAESDATPFDTDVSQVLVEDFTETDNVRTRFAGAIGKSLATGYGPLLFLVKNHGQFSAGPNKKAQYELFGAGGGDLATARHCGIRTGFATTEVDAIIANDLEGKVPDNLYFEISQNGYYIPVADRTGKIIFTPEMYDEKRKTFAGLDRFDGPPLAVAETKPEEAHYNEIQKTKKKSYESQTLSQEAMRVISDSVRETLSEAGVNLKNRFDTGILGARLEDIGSTGRGTNLDTHFDFDLMLSLDANDFPKAETIAQQLILACRYEGNDSHVDQGGYYQLRLKGVREIAGRTFAEPIDLDIGFNRSADVKIFGTHEAIKERLDWIEETVGADTKNEVVANIVLAKEVLKAGHCYKKLEDGGMGGAGVENWILKHEGNLIKAFEAFLTAATDDKGQVVSLEKFRKNYDITDPGINTKYLKHDNFILNLKPEGYQKMVTTITDYLYIGGFYTA